MKRTEEPSWQVYEDEYMLLSEEYIDMIERDLEGEYVDYVSELGSSFFWNFGLKPSEYDMRAAPTSFYEAKGIPSVSKWKTSGGLKGFREWRKKWNETKKPSFPRPNGSTDWLLDVETNIRKILDKRQYPMHYKNLSQVFYADYQGRLSPVLTNNLCQKLKARGSLMEVSPGVWSAPALPGGSTPVALSDIKSSVIDDVLQGWEARKSFHLELREKGIYKSYIEMEDDTRRVF